MMDQLDDRLRERLRVLADAVPVSTEPTIARGSSMSSTRLRAAGISTAASAAALVVVVAIGAALIARAPGSSPLPVPSPSPETRSPEHSLEASAAPPAAEPTRTTVATYMDQCTIYALSPRRCAYIVDWALKEAGVAADEATVELLGDPGCGGYGSGCVRTTDFIVRVRVAPSTGPTSDHSVFCGVGGESSLLCTETPRIRIGSTSGGYHDVPCGPEGAPEDCATPVPTIAPSAAAKAVPLRVPRLTIPIDRTGKYVVDVGEAVLPNGILTEATATLEDDVRTDVLIPESIWLEVIGDDGKPLVNIYEHGWRPGTERVHVRLVFSVDSFEPGASLELSDIVVR